LGGHWARSEERKGDRGKR
jgi:hypothetical protein